jgi:DNA-binding NarL/FixJ family response regulator
MEPLALFRAPAGLDSDVRRERSGASHRLEQSLSALLQEVAELVAEHGESVRAARLLAIVDVLGAPVDSPLASHRNGQRAALYPLTCRETEVAEMLANGSTNRTIAEVLTISERTVDTHVQNILAKLGVNSRVQIASWVVDRHLAPARRGVG